MFPLSSSVDMAVVFVEISLSRSLLEIQICPYRIGSFSWLVQSTLYVELLDVPCELRYCGLSRFSFGLQSTVTEIGTFQTDRFNSAIL